jgi:hypothetical protein
MLLFPPEVPLSMYETKQRKNTRAVSLRQEFAKHNLLNSRVHYAGTGMRFRGGLVFKVF